MKVHWTKNAVGHLVNIFEYIAMNSPVYAGRTVDRITRRSEQIAEHPSSGRKVPEYDDEDIREIIEKPYRIIYRIKSDQVDVLALSTPLNSCPTGPEQFPVNSKIDLGQSKESLWQASIEEIVDQLIEREEPKLSDCTERSRLAATAGKVLEQLPHTRGDGGARVPLPIRGSVVIWLDS